MTGWACRLNCCWSSPGQSFLGPSPAGVMTFHCLRFKTPPTWRAKSPYLLVYAPETGWPSYTPRYWVPFSSPPTTRRATVEVLDTAFTRPIRLNGAGFNYLSIGTNLLLLFLLIKLTHSTSSCKLRILVARAVNGARKNVLLLLPDIILKRLSVNQLTASFSWFLA
jgi:hypothetical protein